VNDARDRGRESDRAYPLLALVSLLTAFVALAVSVDGTELLKEVKQPDGFRLRMMLICGAAGIGSLFGVIVGMRHVCLWRSTIICGATGIAVGLITLGASVYPPAHAPAVVAIFLPVVTVGIFRAFSD
jgi:hypothetical protein